MLGNNSNNRFERLHDEIPNKVVDNKYYRLSKVRERNVRDLNQVKCIKDEGSTILLEEVHIN